ncbi:MAG: hypothetical protein JXR95_14960 [Deltaproteobacteria bacterium]|nr:hypothetical protein [Deltaproteobacteria bacterium]
MKKLALILIVSAFSGLSGCDDDSSSNNTSNNTTNNTSNNITNNSTNNSNDTCSAWQNWVSNCDNCTMTSCDTGYAGLASEMQQIADECVDTFALNSDMCWDFQGDMGSCVGFGQQYLGLVCLQPAICGDGVCNGDETLESCSLDCTGDCGNGTCDETENYDTCPADCTSAVCGNGYCESTEDADSCSDDCGAICGNGSCEMSENWTNCPADCEQTSCDYMDEWVAECEGCSFSVDCAEKYTTLDMGTQQILDDCQETFSQNIGTCDPTGNEDLIWCVGYLQSAFGYSCSSK